jgi:glycogen debranching enzyme
MRIQREETVRATTKARTAANGATQVRRTKKTAVPNGDVVVPPARGTAKKRSVAAQRANAVDPFIERFGAFGAAARQVLLDNDMQFAVKPSPKLYPHQWNWDSGFIAMGLSLFDDKRAQREVLQLLANQWKNGMIPHIVFNPEAKNYFPGPEVWRTEVSKDAPAGRNALRSSGHTQPPVLATAARTVYERSDDRAEALRFIRKAYPRLMQYQEFFYKHRDPGRTGLPYTIHPWETGRDNAPEWVDAMERIELAW